MKGIFLLNMISIIPTFVFKQITKKGCMDYSPLRIQPVEIQPNSNLSNKIHFDRFGVLTGFDAVDVDTAGD
jgi:hypothetical protein